ncbi:MAG: response regulator [Balneolaceae bacterium]
MSKNNIYQLSKLVEQLSHELRTPLNAILGYSQLLEKSENMDEAEKLHLEKIAASGSQLLEVINDIIEISNIESGRIELENNIIGAEYLVHDIEHKFGTTARLKELNLIVKAGIDFKEEIKVDENKLKAVINSLVSNAIKFTNEGRVKVQLRLLKHSESDSVKQLHITIDDTGVGISDEEMNHIFKPFWKGNSEQKKGTGLGLTTCKKLIKILDGTLVIVSEKGKGTKVDLKIPVETVMPENKTNNSGSTCEHKSKTAKGMRALIVDDLPINRTLARIMLEMKDFETIEAENGKEAFDLFQNIKPDVVLMDISMPVMDGIEAMKKIRQIKNDRGNQTPIIAITAGGHTGSRNELIQKGFSEYIQKPYKEQELFEKISLFLPLSKADIRKRSLKSSASSFIS